jgi:hypothetical protein
LFDDVQNTQKELIPGILKVLLLRKRGNNVLECRKKKRMHRGKRKDLLRMQNVALKLRRNVINAGRPIVTL